jgi:hypothetical protein
LPDALRLEDRRRLLLIKASQKKSFPRCFELLQNAAAAAPGAAIELSGPAAAAKKRKVETGGP